MHWLARLTAAGVVLALLALPASPAGAEPVSTPAPATAVHRVTLITGDVVTIRQAAAGKWAVTVDPAKGREKVKFSTHDIDGKLQVLPDDMVPYVADNLIDRSLFAISDLIEQGYDDASSPALPLLLAYDKGTRIAGVLPGAKPVTELESINARAVDAGKGELAAFWKALGEAPAVRSSRPRLASGIKKIWLDAKVKVDLEHSVPQIGAPDAWKSGFDGKGVKVAVLDTGADENHPDLAGKIVDRHNFTADPSTQDGNGHGTHVAATVAGLGAASEGRRKGVAPGAELLIGKVLDDGGSGSFSTIIEGMEWAATSGADVINMSLGGGATDGTDPASAALNALTEQTGALFVVAAGNEGQEYSVGTPGAATSALTVGAVDANEALAGFSSRGPRLDGGAKPDITAPGVGIVAARAEGTSMGLPADERHTAASGTSMATPHVAGTAAILKQRHPEWKAAQLKDALISTARTAQNLTFYEQGGGRVDIARAVSQGVTATGVLDLGSFEDGDSARPAGSITYTNSTQAPVSLTLAATLRNPDGDAPAEGALTLGSSSVTVDAGATVTVPVTADLAKIAHGRNSGHVTASTADGAVSAHTTLAISKDRRTHKVHVTAIGKDGKPSDMANIFMFGPGARDNFLTYILPDEAEEGKTFEVYEGTYFAQGHFSERRSGTHVIDMKVDIPEFQVNDDVELVFDARKTRPIVIKLPQPVIQEGISTFASYRDTGSRTISSAYMNFPSVEELHVAETQPVREGTFEFTSRWQYGAPRLVSRVNDFRGALDLSPMVRSPELSGTYKWQLVDGGRGTPEELKGLNLRGRAVVLSSASSEGPSWDEMITTAAEAGAAMAVVVPAGDSSPWQYWSPAIGRHEIPAATIPYDQGQKLLERIRKGKAVLDVTANMATPYVYDISQVSKGRIPEQIVYEANSKNLARVDAGYHETGGFGWAKEQRFGWRPWQVFSNEGQRWIRTGSARAEYITADDTEWQQVAQHMFTWGSFGPLTPGFIAPLRGYTPGEKVVERWFGPVVRPAIPANVPDLVPTRTEDTLSIDVPEFVDAAGHYSYAFRSDEQDTVSARLYRDGKLVEEPRRAVGDFPAVPGKAAYRLELSTKRSSEEWTYATETDTAWTFTSARPKSGTEPLPLLGIDYSVPADLNGQVRRALPVSLDLSVRSTAPGLALREVTAEISYDDGKSWKRLVLRPRGKAHYSTLVSHHQAGKGGHVSLRVTAKDQAGNAVEQTVLRAYGVK
ncbi:S8 family serine peptidase [Nonomuraea africana]|uniref:Subtilisin family serine protease n=1 Tax=Nonomuraea africana TaxID=46171 RepID=A0ABR9KB01_9ACTN|nr:S8 family serine peptidase [Nonomuraea africana]MBE1558986.1 subtilisin family serine protease [Nonomuraea africana]